MYNLIYCLIIFIIDYIFDKLRTIKIDRSLLLLFLYFQYSWSMFLKPL